MNILAAIDPDEFQSLALKWIGAIGVVSGAAVIMLASLWAKVHAVIDRQDRQSAKTGSLQEQLTQVALTSPPPQPTIITPATPEKP